MLEVLETDGLKVDGDHLDLSLASTEAWPDLGPARSLWIRLGDETAGPAIQFGEAEPNPTGTEVWMPIHHHGTDQFRLILRGDTPFATKRLRVGDGGFQRSGEVYKEGGGAFTAEPLWILTVMADWRGGPSTIVGSRDTAFPLENISDEQIDRTLEADDPYWEGVPAGRNGVSGLVSTLGKPRRGYVWASFKTVDSWPASGSSRHVAATALGDVTCGPIVYLVRCGPGEVAVPGTVLGTEVMFLVVEGSAQVDNARYSPGGSRFQCADAPFSDVVSGPNGVSLVVLVADRRALKVPRPAHDVFSLVGIDG